MPKIGRNQSCPCGSGKKYKNCCNLKPIHLQIENNTASIHSLPKLDGVPGLPGTNIFLTAIRANSNPNHQLNKINPLGMDGEYKVTVLLCKPDELQQKTGTSNFRDELLGDSYLLIGTDKNDYIEFQSDVLSDGAMWQGFANEEGRLGRIVVDKLFARNFQDARIKAYDSISPILSQLSLSLDIPFLINQIKVEELKTKNLFSELTLPYISKLAPEILIADRNVEITKFASLYREALNSNSPNYQYLCFYKIIEGIRNLIEIRTTQENKEALNKGIPPSREKDFVPSNRNEQLAWLSSLYKPQRWSDQLLEQIFPPTVAGKKINEIIGKSKILDNIRNKIAHAILRDESAETFSIDKGIHIDEVSTWLPLCRCLALYLLKKEHPHYFFPN